MRGALKAGRTGVHSSHVSAVGNPWTGGHSTQTPLFFTLFLSGGSDHSVMGTKVSCEPSALAPPLYIANMASDLSIVLNLRII